MANAKRAGRTTATTRRIKHITIKQDVSTKQTLDIKQDLNVKQDLDTKQDMAMQYRNKTSLQANSREIDLWRP